MSSVPTPVVLDSHASHIELQQLRQDLSQTRTTRTAESKDLRKRLKASQTEAIKVPALERRITELEHENRIMKSFAKMGPQVYHEATRLRKELDGTQKLNVRLRRQNSALQRAKRTMAPEALARPSVASTTVGPGAKRDAGADKARTRRSGLERIGGRVAIGVYIDPREIARAKAAMEEQNR